MKNSTESKGNFQDTNFKKVHRKDKLACACMICRCSHILCGNCLGGKILRKCPIPKCRNELIQQSDVYKDADIASLFQDIQKVKTILYTMHEPKA